MSLRWLAPTVFLFGLAVAVVLHWPALANFGIYKDDILQSPHWAAYHASSFQPDDPIVRYASFNESPLQNAIYWVGTWFVEYVRLSKILAVVSYGFLALTMLLVGRAMYGTRFGLLLALFITLFPDQWDYSAGFFSKFWTIPSLALCLLILQKGRYGWLIGLLPFAAVAYPTAAVLIGMIASVHWIQEALDDRARGMRLLRCLAIGSAIAVALLAVKYISPPEGIGAMRPGWELREMPEVQRNGYPSHYIPIPSLDEELVDVVAQPFFLLSAVFYFMVLGRRGVAWNRTWTALFFASAIGYLLADHFFMRLYIPNRYTRYSMALLLALWNARNWDLVLSRLSRRWARLLAIAGLIAVGLLFYADSYREGRGVTDYRILVPVSTFIREELPEGTLIAGSPRALDNVMIQAKRSVLCPYKLAHPWFVDYYDEIRERTRATFRAQFAVTREPINELHERYGVTHFLVEKRLIPRMQAGRRIFASPYNEEIRNGLGGRRGFFLWPPPPDLYLWEDEEYAIIELPIEGDRRLSPASRAVDGTR